MTKILVATEKPFAKDSIDQMKDLALESNFEIVLLEKYTDKKQLLEAVENIECLVVRSDLIDKDVVDAGKKLKIIVRAGA